MICGGLSVVRERRSMWGLSLEKKVCVCVFRAELSHECAEARGSHGYLPLLTSVLFFEIGFLQ